MIIFTGNVEKGFTISVESIYVTFLSTEQRSCFSQVSFLAIITYFWLEQRNYCQRTVNKNSCLQEECIIMYRLCNKVVVSTGYTLLGAAGVVYTANTETKLCKLICNMGHIAMRVYML